MAYNGSGTYTLPTGNPVVTGTTISSSWANTTLSDIATGLTTALCKDGQSTPTANLPMGTFKLTGMGVGSALTDSITLGQAQNQGFLWGGTSGGSANAQTLSVSPSITAYVAGQTFRWKAGFSNSGAMTLAISGLATIASQFNGAAMVGGEIVAGQFYQTTLDTMSTAQTVKIGSSAASGSLISSGYTMSTARLIGRTTAGSGAPEELTVTAPLSIATAGTLTTSVTQAKLLGRSTASTGAAEEISLTGGTSITGGTFTHITLGTEVATTSGTSIDFTGIPTGTKRITINLVGVSSSGVSPFTVQIGPTTVPETSTYLGSCTGPGATLYTSGFIAVQTAVAAGNYSGTMILSLERASTNLWCGLSIVSRTDTVTNATNYGGGSKALAGVLGCIRLTTTGGADTFDAGLINITYE